MRNAIVSDKARTTLEAKIGASAIGVDCIAVIPRA
jgi:hypothetical protein